MRGWEAAVALGLVVFVAGPARACYSGLSIIPTAETVGEGNFSIEPQVDGPVDSHRADLRVLNSQVGFGPRFEAGVDFDLSEDASTRVLLNAKWLAQEAAPRRPALALGVCNAGRRLVASPYVVATHDFARFRAHAGVMSMDGDQHWFAGLDHTLRNGVFLMADYTEGAGNYSSLGAAWELGGPWSTTVALLFPNTRGEETLLSVYLGFTGSYRSTAGAE